MGRRDTRYQLPTKRHLFGTEQEKHELNSSPGITSKPLIPAKHTLFLALRVLSTYFWVFLFLEEPDRKHSRSENANNDVINHVTSPESPTSAHTDQHQQLPSLTQASVEQDKRLSSAKTPNTSQANFRFQDSPLLSLSPSDKALIGSMAQYGGVGGFGSAGTGMGSVASRTSCQYASGTSFGSPSYALTPPHFGTGQYGAHASMYHAYASPHHHPYSASSLGMTSQIMAAIQNSSGSSQGSASSLTNLANSNLLESDSQALQADLLSPSRIRSSVPATSHIASPTDLLQSSAYSTNLPANSSSAAMTSSGQSSNLPLSPCALLHDANSGQGQTDR